MKSSSVVVPVPPSLATALTPAGSEAYPTMSWPPRINRRAMLPPIRPSPTIPSCMRSSSVSPLTPLTSRSVLTLGGHSSRAPDELAEDAAVGDDHHGGGAEKEARVDDAGNRADRLLEPHRVVDRARRAIEDHVEIVGHERPLVQHPQCRLELEVFQATPAERRRERKDLHRKRTARPERLDQ